jgi:hypothetical protein
MISLLLGLLPFHLFLFFIRPALILDYLGASVYLQGNSKFLKSYCRTIVLNFFLGNLSAVCRIILGQISYTLYNIFVC